MLTHPMCHHWICDLQGTMPDEATIKRLIRKGTCDQKFVPMVCGTAFKNKGVQPLLDAVVDYLPSPLDIPDVQVRDIRLWPEIVRLRMAWCWAGLLLPAIQ